ncbi:hypothetical protein DBR47_12015 [Paucibacter sp. KBW04]|uniref:hypothetical protein n=1 Tax=Paucibacter sp. KBW04 TaxID=2153361 RepID=UPI000F57B05D|nr:hypothetical protein [Paucibacter sp. KBW04]RQO59365.1 hypothetical protein DBR47_12015 [Paucibacter sp. KBW04]
MNPPSTAREALIVEMIGDMAALADRVEALIPELEKSRKSMADVNKKVCAEVKAIESRMDAIMGQVRIEISKDLTRQTSEAARKAIAIQNQAIEEAARTALGVEIRPTLQELLTPLRQLAYQVHEHQLLKQQWLRWLRHVATASTASALTWVAAAVLWLR